MPEQSELAYIFKVNFLHSRFVLDINKSAWLCCGLIAKCSNRIYKNNLQVAEPWDNSFVTSKQSSKLSTSSPALITQKRVTSLLVQYSFEIITVFNLNIWHSRIKQETVIWTGNNSCFFLIPISHPVCLNAINSVSLSYGVDWIFAAYWSARELKLMCLLSCMTLNDSLIGISFHYLD